MLPMSNHVSQLEADLGHRRSQPSREVRKIKNGIDLLQRANVMRQAGWTPTDTFRPISPMSVEELVGGITFFGYIIGMLATRQKSKKTSENAPQVSWCFS